MALRGVGLFLKIDFGINSPMKIIRMVDTAVSIRTDPSVAIDSQPARLKSVRSRIDM